MFDHKSKSYWKMISYEQAIKYMAVALEAPCTEQFQVFCRYMPLRRLVKILVHGELKKGRKRSQIMNKYGITVDQYRYMKKEYEAEGEQITNLVKAQ